MKPESRREIARRRVCEAEAMVARQKQLVDDLQKAGAPTQGAIILLALLHGSLRAYRDAVDLMESDGPLDGAASRSF